MLAKGSALLRSWVGPRTGFVEFSYFPFNSAQPLSSEALEVLSAVSTDLHSLGVRAFVSDGTLLGLVRDGNLIAHDNDLDFVVLGLGWNKAIGKIMKRNGLKLASLSRLGARVYHMSFFDEAEHIVDFTFYEQVGSNYVSFRDSNYYFVIPLALVANLIWLEVGAARVRVPERSWDFLQLQYGKSWRTPEEQKHDWKESYYGTRRTFRRDSSVTLTCRSDVIAQLLRG